MTEPERPNGSEPDVDTDAMPDLAAQLEAAARERDDAVDQMRRTQAEFLNFQKRSRAQADAAREYAAGPLSQDLLPVIDNFERAIDAARQSGSESIVAGLDMVRKQLLDAMAKHGVEPIAALDRPFDPNLHEALNQQPDPDRPEGTVVAEHSRGYTLRDRVLRPSRVAVSVKPSE